MVYAHIKKLLGRKVPEEKPNEPELVQRPSAFDRNAIKDFFKANTAIPTFEDAGYMATLMFHGLPEAEQERFVDMATEVAWDLEDYANELAVGELKVPSFAIYMAMLYIGACWQTTIMANAQAHNPESADEMRMMIKSARDKVRRGERARTSADVAYM